MYGTKLFNTCSFWISKYHMIFEYIYFFKVWDAQALIWLFVNKQMIAQ